MFRSTGYADHLRDHDEQKNKIINQSLSVEATPEKTVETQTKTTVPVEPKIP
jgi:hypothetical protein